jgi:hypothetical protein
VSSSIPDRATSSARRLLVAWASVVVLGCGGCAPPPETAPPSRPPATWPFTIAPAASAAFDAGSGDAGTDASAPSDAGLAVAAADDPETVEARQLARDLLRSAGSLAYSPSTSTFVYLLSYIEEGSGAGLTFHVARAGDEKPFETLSVCEAWECGRGRERQPWIEAALPKVVERVRGKGYVLLTPVRWPEGQSQMTLAAPPLTLRWQQDRLIAVRPGKAAVTSPRVRHLPEHKTSPEAVAIVPDGSWIAVDVTFDPGSNYGHGYNGYSEVHTYRVP